jgi:NADH-quinone oxidoreductase subunit G
MVREGGTWKPIDWAHALELLAAKLKAAPAERIGAIAAPTATVEELHLLQKLVRGLGGESVDARPRAAVSPRKGSPVRTLGRPIASLTTLSRALVVGSFLRKDHPLFAQRLRQAAKHGCKVMSLHALRDDWLLPVGPSVVAAPSQWVAVLESMLGDGAAASDDARAVASMLAQGSGEGAILLGNAVASHPQAAAIERAARALGAATGLTVGWLGEGGNTVGADLVEARPGEGGRDAARMLSGDDPLEVLVTLHAEPERDANDGIAAARALAGTGFVARLTPFVPAPGDHADLVLPVAPFSETSGTFVNAEVRIQSFHGTVKPLGETRPAWKVLRVLGNLLGLPGFDFDTSEAVRIEALGDASAMEAKLAVSTPGGAAESAGIPGPTAGLERIADVPIYAVDAIVRRSPPLQATADARPPVAGVPSEWAAEHGLVDGATVRVAMGEASAELPITVDATLAAGVVRIPASVPLGALHGSVTVEPVRAGTTAAALSA